MQGMWLIWEIWEIMQNMLLDFLMKFIQQVQTSSMMLNIAVVHKKTLKSGSSHLHENNPIDVLLIWTYVLDHEAYT